jgi:hypothetical protein
MYREKANPGALLQRIFASCGIVNQIQQSTKSISASVRSFFFASLR